MMMLCFRCRCVKGLRYVDYESNWTRFFLGVALLVAILGVIGIGIYQYFFSPDGWLIAFLAIFFLGDANFALYLLIFLGIGVLIAGIFVLIKGYRAISYAKEEAAIFSRAVEYSEHVTVVSKLSQNSTEDAFTYLVSFDFQDGKRKSFAVDITQYSTLLEGEVGLLSYKENGDRLFFLSFQPSRSRLSC